MKEKFFNWLFKQLIKSNTFESIVKQYCSDIVTQITEQMTKQFKVEICNLKDTLESIQIERDTLQNKLQSKPKRHYTKKKTENK